MWCLAVVLSPKPKLLLGVKFPYKFATTHSSLSVIHSCHWRHEPILVTCKTLTKSSTYVKFVITFEGTANPTHNLSLCGSHNIIGMVNC